MSNQKEICSFCHFVPSNKKIFDATTGCEDIDFQIRQATILKFLRFGSEVSTTKSRIFIVFLRHPIYVDMGFPIHNESDGDSNRNKSEHSKCMCRLRSFVMFMSVFAAFYLLLFKFCRFKFRNHGKKSAALGFIVVSTISPVVP